MACPSERVFDLQAGGVVYRDRLEKARAVRPFGARAVRNARGVRRGYAEQLAAYNR